MKKNTARSFAAMLLVFSLTLAACVSADFATVNADPNFFNGFGSGPTETTAKDAAFNDLVDNIFAQPAGTSTAQMKAAVAGLQLKPFVVEKKGQSFHAVYKLKRSVWETAEAKRLATLAADLGGRFQTLSSSKSALGPRLTEASGLSVMEDKAGVSRTLKVSDEASPLLSAAIEGWVRNQLLEVKIQVKPDSGIIEAGQSVGILITDPAGHPISLLPLLAVWTTPGSSVPTRLTTDVHGSASIVYPSDGQFKNKEATLTLSPNLHAQVPEAGFLAAVDADHRVRFSFRSVEDLANFRANEVSIPGGTFTVGAVAQDRHAGSNEVARVVKVASFWIDRYLVTNTQYTAYLDATKVPQSQWPDYLASPKYGQADQPVIGVTFADAQRYAAWLSGVLGETKRLPTEDEYEIAARGSRTVIFPWGDQAPGDGPRANFSGNSRFTATSPVTSFESGKNPFGLFDMVGNVWEWTSTSPYGALNADPAFKIVKGGSWLDGPNELRISNRRAVNPNEPASDIGFRLVREGVHE